MNPKLTPQDPHAGAAILAAGEKIAKARAAVVMIHGRGATANDILSLAAELDGSEFTFAAPQAVNFTWYPNRFNTPTVNNEPWLSSALKTVQRTLEQLSDGGIPLEKTILLGFSQGACLVLEYAARNPSRYGGIIGFSGGLIGSDDEKRQDQGSLAGTPVFLGCSNVDFHIPEYRVHHAAETLKALGARVETRIYPDMGHTINDDEIAAAQSLMDDLER